MSEMKNIPSSSQRQVDFLDVQVTFKAYLPNRVFDLIICESCLPKGLAEIQVFFSSPVLQCSMKSV